MVISITYSKNTEYSQVIDYVDKRMIPAELQNTLLRISTVEHTSQELMTNENILNKLQSQLLENESELILELEGEFPNVKVGAYSDRGAYYDQDITFTLID